jgi:SAM-dependent methyltransferase
MSVQAFNYSDYEFSVRLADEKVRRSHREHLQQFVQHFRGCKHVLDVACGPGVFLELLTAEGIKATGIDADPKVVQFAQSKGCHAVQSDIVDFLENTSERFDGVFCSHVIEHLPFEAVLRVIQGASKCIGNEGVFVLAFPNPRALRTHLDQFWIDPQHVRFYDSRLIEGVLQWCGFTIVSNSDDRSSAPLSEPRSSADALEGLPIFTKNLRGVGRSAWLHTSCSGPTWKQLKKKVALRLRTILGITELSQELESVGLVVHEMFRLMNNAGLTNEFDMEVRLVAKKTAGKMTPGGPLPSSRS